MLHTQKNPKNENAEGLLG